MSTKAVRIQHYVVSLAKIDGTRNIDPVHTKNSANRETLCRVTKLPRQLLSQGGITTRGFAVDFPFFCNCSFQKGSVGDIKAKLTEIPGTLSLIRKRTDDDGKYLDQLRYFVLKSNSLSCREQY